MQKVSIASYKAKEHQQLQSPIDPNTPAPATISTSQQSYDQQIQHFAGLTSVLNQSQVMHQTKPL
jgi:hypothetical protein